MKRPDTRLTIIWSACVLFYFLSAAFAPRYRTLPGTVIPLGRKLVEGGEALLLLPVWLLGVGVRPPVLHIAGAHVWALILLTIVGSADRTTRRISYVMLVLMIGSATLTYIIGSALGGGSN